MPLFYSFCLLLPNLVPKKEKPAASEVLMNVDEMSRDFKDLSKTVLVHGVVVPIGHFEMLFMSIEARHKTPKWSVPEAQECTPGRNSGVIFCNMPLLHFT